MPVKFTIFDKETAKEVKKMLKERKKNFSVKNKDEDENKKEINLDNPVDNNPVAQPQKLEKKKRGRKKLTKDEKNARKKKRTPEEQAKINERMKKLRMARLAKKKEKNEKINIV